MKEELQAASEIAKTTGKAIDASREVGGFISRFIKGPLEQGIGIFEDKLKYMRWERQLALMDKVNQKMTKRGLDKPTQPVPMKIAIPLFQEASLEEDDSLQELWANLLVNAADKDSEAEVQRTHISLLHDLTPMDAICLNKAYSKDVESGVEIGVWALPESIFLGYDPEVEPTIPIEKVALSIENLCRLSLLRSAMWAHADAIRSVYQTRLGRSFYKACNSTFGIHLRNPECRHNTLKL